MRLFIAIEIPGAIQRCLADGSRGLRAELPKARWVRAELMHLTLVFLGDTDPDLLGNLDRELTAAVAEHPRMHATVSGTGAFPPRGKARVLWAGVDVEGDLDALQKAVEGAAERVVGPFDDRKKSRFNPHVTLARCRPPWPRWAVEKFVSAPAWKEPSEAFEIHEAVLIESELRPGGPRYRTRSSYPLGGVN